MARAVILLLFLTLQVGFWFQTYLIKPQLGIVPPLPSQQEVAALSFGDEQFYFRVLALKLQMAGDTFGRSTPLKDYDYPLLKQWFFLMDGLDFKSNYVPSFAAYYFTRSQNPKDTVHILDYLEERSMRDPQANWWWLSQSIYIANSILGDKPRAIRIAEALRKVKGDLPLWARQMEAFLQEDMGDKRAARDIMCDTFNNIPNFKDIPDRELNFMDYFFTQRLGISKQDNAKTIEQKLNDIAAICQKKAEDQGK